MPRTRTKPFTRIWGWWGTDFNRLAWNGFVAIDLLEKKLRETRPYERTCRGNRQSLPGFPPEVLEALRDRGADGVLHNACRAFKAVPLKLPGPTRRGAGRGDLYPRQQLFQ